jgi:hypothetical protein
MPDADIYWLMLRRSNLYEVELDHDDEPTGELG